MWVASWTVLVLVWIFGTHVNMLLFLLTHIWMWIVMDGAATSGATATPQGTTTAADGVGGIFYACSISCSRSSQFQRFVTLTLTRF